MYTITFYSFKGGVGRTMALVNVAAELVRQGRKVLVVDFDLEAPGVTTYKYLRPPKPSPGVVEYVTEFIQTNESPDVSRFVYPVDLTPVLSRLRRRKSGKQVADADIRESTGHLWVMPAGKGDAAYGAALAAINWNSLYENQHGYLFFEDTKLQWEKLLFKPDYVLIDSRTGHTDVGGICTRQLADAVVLMFTPNEQNRLGLRDVCNAIRAEKKEDGRSITMHLVMSNVPRLDDEEDILRRHVLRFRKALGFTTLDGVIDRYDSLMHLDQRVFVLERPRSRLARQYRRLVQRLIVRNVEDREGVMVQLRQASELENPLNSPGADSLMDLLERATDAHSKDQEILVLGAELHIRMLAFPEANDLLDRALRLGDSPEVRRLRSGVRFQLGRKELAVDDLLAAIHFPASPERLVVQAIKDLHRYDPQRLQKDVAWELLHALSAEAKMRVAELFATPEDSFARAMALLQEALSEAKGALHSFLCRFVPSRLSIYLLYRREWTKVIDVLRELLKSADFRSYPLELFRLALARWALDGEMPKKMCEALEGYTPGYADEVAGYHEEGGAEEYQALALVHWRLGDRARAKEYIRKALQLIDRREKPTLSYWRCLEASPEEFREDCRQIDRLIDGERLQPLFLAERPRPEPSEPNTA